MGENIPVFATCSCGSTLFEVMEHRLVCPECGSGVDVPELNLLKLVSDANAVDPEL